MSTTRDVDAISTTSTITTATVNIIVAIGNHNVIGYRNKMPWYVREDLAMFKKVTKGHTVIMGRKTYESIGNRPLPYRRNVILTKSISAIAGCEIVRDERELFNFLSREYGDVFVIGGATLYKLMMPLACRIYTTHIYKIFEGDTYFPNFSCADMSLLSYKSMYSEHEHCKFVMRVWEKIPV